MRYVLGAFVFAALASPAAAEVVVEYVAHASFLVRSSSGATAAIDPFTSGRWLGYRYPPDVSAGVVLVTHPHYDHDADYQFGGRTPTLRLPGEYAFGDLRLTGVEGRHALHYGQEFGQMNTIWMIETDGVRIVHVGDSGPLSAAALATIGSADVLMAPVDDLDHILTAAEADEMARLLGVKVLIPMHYRIESLSPLPRSVGPIDQWLAARPAARRLESHRFTLSRETLPKKLEIWVPPPSPDVKPWSEALGQAWKLRDQAREAFKQDPRSEAALDLLRQARALAPRVIEFVVELADALLGIGRDREAERALEHAVLTIARPDHEYGERARLMLARLYREDGRAKEAAEQYRFILDRTYRLEWRAEAEEFSRGAAR